MNKLNIQLSSAKVSIQLTVLVLFTFFIQEGVYFQKVDISKTALTLNGFNLSSASDAVENLSMNILVLSDGHIIEDQSSNYKLFEGSINSFKSLAQISKNI